MRYVVGDPYWLTAKYPATCKCGTAIPAGARAFYWPKGSTGRKLECEPCGETSERRFLAETADEYFAS